MKKGKLHIPCLLFSFILSAVIFHIAAGFFFRFFWNFDIFSSRHWGLIQAQWERGYNFNKPKEIMFFAAIVLSIPSYLFFWFLTYIFPWNRFFFFPVNYWKKRKKEKLLAKSIAAATGPGLSEPVTKKKEPQKVKPPPSDKMKEIDRLRGKGTSGHSAPVPQSQHPQEASTGHLPQQTASSQTVSDSELTEADEALARVEYWEELVETLEAANLFVFREMKIGAFVINTLVVTGDGIFFLCEGPVEGKTWEINEKANPPSWKLQDGSILLSPLRPMINARDKMRDYIEKEMPEYNHVSVNACMIVDHGNILNTNDLLRNLENWDVSVLRMGTCKTEILPDTTALIGYIKSQTPSTQEMNDAVAIAILDLMESEENV